MLKKRFISVDWGTTNLRIRLVSIPSLKIEDEIVLDDGVKSLYNQWTKDGGNRTAFFLDFLQDKIASLPIDQDTIPPVLISGMASSSIGLKELPYAQLPFHIDGNTLHVERLNTSAFKNGIFLISGVQSDSDVIRGEEIQMVGLLKENDTCTSVVILPGTHSKHVIVKNGQVIDFKTYMTGELFDVILENTILNAALEVNDFGKDQLKSFEKGVTESSKGKSILHTLFSVRTNVLFNKLSPKENYHYLSGLLIGEELLSLKKHDCDNIKLCAGGKLFDLYFTAIEVLGLSSKTQIYSKEEVDASVVKGQWKVYNSLQISKV